MAEVDYQREFVECLRRADRREGCEVGHLCTWHWARGWAKHLEAIGMLERTHDAEWWLCERCEAVSAHVERRYFDDRGVHMAKICCRERGYHLDAVEVEQLKQWEVSLSGVATLVAGAIDDRLVCRAAWPGRLVSLGSTNALGPPTTLFVARGLGWDDGRDVVERCDAIRRAASPLLLTLDRAPCPERWDELLPPVLPLTELARLRAGSVELDIDRLSAAASAMSPNWLTQPQAVELLAKDLGRRDRKQLTALVSTAGSRHEFRTNGSTGRRKLIDAVSFAAWRLRKRDEALDEAERTPL